MARIVVPGLPFAFKTKRIRDEFIDEPLDPRLRAILFAQAWRISTRHGFLYELTDIIRTREEQLVIYPDDPGKRSVHELHRGADGVVREFSDDDYRYMVEWTNKYFPYKKPEYKTCKFHDVGMGPHLHNQVAAI